MTMLNIIGRYSEHWGDLELEGTEHDLRALAETMQTEAPQAERQLEDPMEVHHRPLHLQRIHVSNGTGPVQIRREGDTLHVAGALEYREILAASIRSVADAGPTGTGVRRHAHIEYIDSDGWISSTSEPLVVSLRG